MIGKTYSACTKGVSGLLVEVEADVSNGIPGIELTGNLSGIVKESRERVRLAIRNSRLELRPSKIVINLAPAKLRKEGTHFDLAIAIAVLCANNNLEETFNDTIFIGELALDGRVLAVKGVLPMIDMAKRLGFRRCIVPKKNMGEGKLIDGVEVYGVESLWECVEFLKGKLCLAKEDKEIIIPDELSYKYDFLDIRGQIGLKRGLLIATAGMHNTIMVGPPGAGKTMSAMRINTIMPPLTREQIIDISRIYSISGKLNQDGYVKHRPFRTPNHTITPSAMAGGGINPLPGEMSLAEYGVLFLDELNLFRPETMETLRLPMETGCVQINRVNGNYFYPADFMLVGAINPCKCGYYPDKAKCSCTPREVSLHIGKISRPILDRIDMCIQAPKVKYEDMEPDVNGSDYSSEKMRNIVLKVHKIQQNRFLNEEFQYNSKIPINKINEYCPMEKDAKELMKQVYAKYDLTARAYHKLIRVARTIADIEEHEKLTLSDVGEAVGYKMLEVK